MILIPPPFDEDNQEALRISDTTETIHEMRKAFSAIKMRCAVAACEQPSWSQTCFAEITKICEDALRTRDPLAAGAPPAAPATQEPTPDPEGAATLNTEDDPRLDIMPAVREEMRELRQRVVGKEAMQFGGYHQEAPTKALGFHEPSPTGAATPLHSVTETAKEIAIRVRGLEVLSNIEFIAREVISRLLGARELEIRELRAECERLREDKERLNWVEEHTQAVVKAVINQKYTVKGTTVRLIIDAAMQPKEKTK